MIYIILPVHNRKNVTENFIKSLIAQTYKNYKLILVDDGCKDGTVEMVLKYLPDSIVIKGDGNLWWAGALQKGYEWLITNAEDEDICLLINDDTKFEPNFLKIAMQVFSKKEKTLLMAQCYSQNDLRLLDMGVHADLKKLTFVPAKKKEEINCLATRGMFLKVRDFKNIGGFYPKLLPHYLSDYEFSIRAFKKGYKLETDESLRLYVNEHTTGFHNLEYSGIIDYYSKYFSKKNQANRFYWLIFVVLTVPMPYKIYQFVRIFMKMVKDILKPFYFKFIKCGCMR